MSRFKKQVGKFLSFLAMASLFAYGGILNVSFASAEYAESAIVENNIIASGVLNFRVAETDFSGQIKPSDNVERLINFTSTSTIDFTYQISVVNVATSSLCNVLELKDDIFGSYVPLASFVSATGTFASLPDLALTAKLATTSPALVNQVCQFDFVIIGWQTNFPDASLGFSFTQGVSSTITAGDWQADPPPPVQTIQAGDVVINELMWMGSASSSADEWLELRNMTDQAIDIGGWQLTKKSGGNEVLMLEIPAGKIIALNGYFLISEYDTENSAIKVTPDLIVGSGQTNEADFALANTNLQIKLYQADWNDAVNLMDITDDGLGNPLAGVSGSIKESMERNDLPGDGALAGSWHTCHDASSTAMYWDNGQTDRGTPGAPNLSDESNIQPLLPDLMMLDEGSITSTVEDLVEETDNGDIVSIVEESMPAIESKPSPDLPLLESAQAVSSE